MSKSCGERLFNELKNSKIYLDTKTNNLYRDDILIGKYILGIFHPIEKNIKKNLHTK